MRRVYRKALPYFAVALFVGFLAYGTNGVMSLFMMQLVDHALAGEREGMMDAGTRLLVAALLLLIFQSGLSLAKGWYRRKANILLKRHYLEGVFRKNINEFNKDSNARYVSGITNDLSTLDIHYVDGLFELSLSLVSFFVVVFIIARVNGTVLLAILLMTVGMAGISQVLSKPVARLFQERMNLYERYTAYVGEVLLAFRIIKTNDLQERVMGNFRSRGKALQTKSFEIERTSTYIYALQNSTISLVVLGVMAVSVYFNIQGTLSFGGIILITSNLQSIMGPFRQAGELYPKIISARGTFKALDDTLRNAVEHVETVEMQPLEEGIEFRGVSFGYGEHKVFEDLNLRFEKGRKYLVVGPSGGGKSTLLKLIRKYHAPEAGTLTVDGVPLWDLTKESYFQRIANVDQNIFIFDDTLRNNLTLYRDAPPKKVQAVVDRAGLSAFVQGLEQGLETPLRDNGRNISGGERSRIAIARALLDEVDILLLDEAFASLDYATAKRIEDTLLSIPGLTVINVSHLIIRENQARYDAVYQVEEGRVRGWEP